MLNQRGSILLFSFLILIAMFSIATTLADIFIPKIRGISDASNSTQAIYAADTGSEACLYEARRQPGSAVVRPILTNGATFTIASLSASPVDVTNDCRPLKINSFRFRSVGAFRGISRALEVSQ